MFVSSHVSSLVGERERQDGPLIVMFASCACYSDVLSVIWRWLVCFNEKDKKHRVAGCACLWLRLVFATWLLRLFCLLFLFMRKTRNVGLLVVLACGCVLCLLLCCFDFFAFFFVWCWFVPRWLFRLFHVCFTLVRFFTFVYRYSLTLARFALVGFLAFMFVSRWFVSSRLCIDIP